MHATPIKDDVKRLLDQAELGFHKKSKSAIDFDLSDDGGGRGTAAPVLANSERWTRGDLKKVAAAFGYLQLLRLKDFLLKRYKFVPWPCRMCCCRSCFVLYDV